MNHRYAAPRNLLSPFRPFIRLLAACLPLWLSACAAETPTPPPAPRIQVIILATSAAEVGFVEPSAVEVASPTPVPPTPAPVDAPTPVPPTAPPSQCPTPGSPAAPDYPGDFSAIADALAPYLSAGASPAAVRDLLTGWGVLYAVANGAPLGRVETANLLPGDDPQLVVVFHNPAGQDGVAQAGDVAVYACAGGAMQTVYRALADPAYNGLVPNPRLVSLDDVTGDGLADLSLATGDCGANTCFDALRILSAAGGGGLANIIPDFAPAPYPAFAFVPAPGGPGRDLLARIGLLGSVGAGPQRVMTETWSYDGAVFTVRGTLVEPPVYRMHALHDADAAFRRKDYDAARGLYERVISDPGLQDWEGVAPLRGEAEVLGAFARLRLVELAAATGDAAGVSLAYEALKAAAPEGSPGEVYATLGETFYAVYAASGDATQACQAAARLAEKTPNTYILLGSQTFGYANYDYQPRDMCVLAES